MRTLVAAALLAAVLPTAAAAGPVLGARLGYASSGGDAAKDTPMSKVAAAEIPLQLDLAWRINPRWTLGVYYGFGFGRLSKATADRCDALGVSCSVWSMRTGAQATYAFADVSERWAPWLGFGIGYEWLHEHVSERGGGTQNLSGWEYLNLEGGADVRLSSKLSAGPYVSARFGQLSRLDGYGIPNTGWHQWLGAGVRGHWDF
jgi:hypothetical protein